MPITTQSLRFVYTVPDYLTYLEPTAGVHGACTVNFWFKRYRSGVTTLGGESLYYFYCSGGVPVFQLFFDSNDRLNAHCGYIGNIVTNNTVTDNLWHNVNVTAGTGTFDVSLDGTLCNYASKQTDSGLNGIVGSDGVNPWQIGGPNYFSGQMDLFYFIDGYNYNPTWFTDSNNKPIAFNGNYGTYGFFLNFENSSNVGLDSGPNHENFTPHGFVTADSLSDNPSATPLFPIPFVASGALTVDATPHLHIGPLVTPPLVGSGALTVATTIRSTRQPTAPSLFIGAAALMASVGISSSALPVGFSGSGSLGAGVNVNIDPHSARGLLGGSGALTADSSILTQFQRYSLDITDRVRRLIPGRWFSWVAPIRDSVIGGLSDGMAWLRQWIDYARAQSRLATAYSIWLDIFAYDYLRRHLLRNNLTDDAFRAKIRATILQERVTRAGMIGALTQLVGSAPAIIEPWNTGDCGGYGEPNVGYDVAGYWGSIQLPGQVFIKVSRTNVGPTGVPLVAGYGGPMGGYDTGAIEYVGSAVSQIGITDPDIYDIIETAKPTGVTAWTRIS